MTELTTRVSEREIVATSIAQVIIEMGMTNPFGGDVKKTTQENGRSYYGVLFSRPATLDGFVRVYSPTFILVESSRTGKEKFTGEKAEQAAIEYLKEEFGG